MNISEIKQKKGYSPLYCKGVDSFDFDGNKTVSMYLASFGNRDNTGDVIVKGAFAKSLQERGVNSTSPRKIAYLKYHDQSRPIGKFTVLQEDNKGLYAEAILDETTDGIETAKQYKSGSINQHSIGYNYVWDKMEYDQDSDSYICKELVLWEGSAVTIGMNENTPFNGFKSLESIEEIQIGLENLLKGMDHTVSYNLRSNISKLLALANSQPIEEMKSLIKINEPQITQSIFAAIGSKIK